MLMKILRLYFQTFAIKRLMDTFEIYYVMI